MFLIPDRVAGMCKSRSCTDMGFTILAIRCDTSEETRVQQVRALTEPKSNWQRPSQGLVISGLQAAQLR